jgi:hypothetical protein
MIAGLPVKIHNLSLQLLSAMGESSHTFPPIIIVAITRIYQKSFGVFC